MTTTEDRQFRSVTRAARAWGPVAAWLALIFVLSAQPGLRISPDPGVDLPIRHVAHVISYGVLTVLLTRALNWGSSRRARWRLLLLAMVLATLYGVSDEVHQTYVPNRTGHLLDVGWDLLGAIAGAAFLRLTPRRWLERASVVARPE